MLVRVGTCQVCEATYQLPQRFEGAWARCRICGGAVFVGEAIDAELAQKRGARKGGKADAAAGSASPATKSAKGAGDIAAAPTKPGIVTATAPGIPSANAAQTSSAPPSASQLPSESPAPAAQIPLKAPESKPSTPTAHATPASTAPASRSEAPAAEKWSPKALEAELLARRASSPPSAARPPEPVPALDAQIAASGAVIDEMSLEELEPPISARPSTLERLKAERAEQARLAQRAAPPSAAPQSGSERQPAPGAKPGSTLERLKAERAKAAAAEGARTGGGGRPSVAPSRSEAAGPPARADRGVRAPNPPSDSDGSGSVGRAAGRRPRAAAPGARKGPHPMIAVGSLALVGGLAALAFQQGWLGKSDEPKPPQETAGATGAQATTEALPAPAPLDPFAAGSAAATPSAAASLAQASATPPAPVAQTPAPAATPPSAQAKAAKDAASVDLGAYGPFEPLPETSAEDWVKLQGWVKDLLNPNAGAEAGRARARLEEAGKAAFPALLNGLLALDYGARDGMTVGNDGVQVFQKICRGLNFGWRTDDDPKAVEYFNKRVIEVWAQRWQVASQDEAAWAEMAKLNQPSGDESSGNEDG